MASTKDTDGSTKDQNSKIIRWGIIGLGDVCQKKSGPAFYKCQGSELVAVMKRTPGQAAAWANANVPPLSSGESCTGYDNLSDFLAQSQPAMDAVYIATRPGTHLELARKVAAAGKAVYVEKPVGRCAAEAEAIAKVCEDAGVPLYTAYISRAYERTQAIRKLLAEGVVGDKVTSIEYTLVGMGGARGMDTQQELPWRLDAKQSGGGLIMDVGCHVIDRIDYLCGPLMNVKGRAENRVNRDVQKVEDYVHFEAIIGDTPQSTNQEADNPPIPCKGASVTCTWDFSGANDSEEIDELVLTGPKGSLRMAGMSPAGPIHIHDTGGNLIRTVDDFSMPEHTAQGLIQVITNDLLDASSAVKRPTLGLSKGDNAIRTQKVLDAALSSYYGGREEGYWDRTPESWPGYRDG